jgi:hypothetical protein
MSQEITERIFAVTEPARLRVENIRGSVEVKGGATHEMHIQATKHLDSGDSEHTEIVIEQSSDGSVMVKTRFDNISSWFAGQKPCKVDYQIQLPSHCAVDIQGVSCNQSIGGVEGKVRMNSVSGLMKLSDLNGDLDIKTVSGDITAERIHGKLGFDSVSGDVNLQTCNFEEISGKTVSGDVILQTPLARGPYDFKSVSGNVKLRLPKAQGVTLELMSVSGDIKKNVKTTRSNNRPGSKRYEFWGGGVEIRLKSVSGDLEVEAEGDQTPTHVEQDLPARSRLEILEAIENGSLSVEEGIRRLS